MKAGSHHSETTKRLMRGPRPLSKGALRGPQNPRWGAHHSIVAKCRIAAATRRSWQRPALRRRMIEGIRAALARKKAVGEATNK